MREPFSFNQLHIRQGNYFYKVRKGGQSYQTSQQVLGVLGVLGTSAEFLHYFYLSWKNATTHCAVQSFTFKGCRL